MAEGQEVGQSAGSLTVGTVVSREGGLGTQGVSQARSEKQIGLPGQRRPETTSRPAGQEARPNGNQDSTDLTPGQSQIIREGINNPNQAREALKTLAGQEELAGQKGGDEGEGSKPDESLGPADGTTGEPQAEVAAETPATAEESPETITDSDEPDQEQLPEPETDYKKAISLALFESEEQLDNLFEGLSQSSNPEDRALAIDLKTAYLTRELEHLQKKQRLANKQKIDQLQQEIGQITGELARLKSQREEIKDKDGNSIDNQITKFVEGLFTSDEEKKQAQENPLGFLEEKLRNNKARETLLTQVKNNPNLGQEEKEFINGLIAYKQAENEQKKQEIKENLIRQSKNIAKNSAGLAAILALIIAWRSLTTEMAGGQGQR